MRATRKQLRLESCKLSSPTSKGSSTVEDGVKAADSGIDEPPNEEEGDEDVFNEETSMGHDIKLNNQEYDFCLTTMKTNAAKMERKQG